MKKSLFLMISVLMMAAFAVRPVSAGTLTPRLQAALQPLSSDQELPIIITFAERLNPSKIKHRSRRIRRARLIRALKSKADLSQAALRRFLKGKKARRMLRLWLINGLALTARRDVIRQLASNPRVARIELDYAVPMAETPVGAPIPAEWNIDAVHAPELWALGFTGQGVTVAIMDSGVDLNHPDLGPRYRGGNNSWFDPNGQHLTPYDADGHGTAVMGIMVGGDFSGTSIGVAPDARWIAVKIFNDAGEASLSAIHQGFQWLLDPDGNPDTDDAPDVVNNSWDLNGTLNECNTEFSGDIAALRDADIAVVFSAGNNGPGAFTSVSPANDPGSFAAGAVDSFFNIAGFSSRGPSACGGGPYPDVMAPGVSIRTADLTFGGIFPDSYAWLDGTSFAAPHVSGGMALLRSAYPEATVSQLETAIADAALDLGDPDESRLLDLAAAYQLLAEIPTTRPGILQFEASGYAVKENGGRVIVTVTRTDGTDGLVSVDYATQDGTATAGEDYESVWGTLDFADGEASRTFSVPLLDDEDYEGNEDLTLTLSNAAGGASLGNPAGSRITILEDDPPPLPGDADGDGFTSDEDCNDSDDLIYPGAAEIKHDKVDQDCNGYDLTLDIFRAIYQKRRDRLIVLVTSDLERRARLRMTLSGKVKHRVSRRFWGINFRHRWAPPGRKWATARKITRRMVWNRHRNRWQKSINRFKARFGFIPLKVEVSGIEGTESARVAVR